MGVVKGGSPTEQIGSKAVHMHSFFVEEYYMIELNIYDVKLKYIRDLQDVDSNVMSQSPQIAKSTRIYVGVIIMLNGQSYCIPFSSGTKAKFQIKNKNPDMIKIPDLQRKDENGAYKTLAVLNINNMIPVNETVIEMIDIHNYSTDTVAVRNRKALMQKEIRWCRENADLIVRRAQKVYYMVTEQPQKNINLTRRCCDFKKLEAVLERRLAKVQSNEYEPKEKAVAASAEIPVRHPAFIRRRKNTGRSR